MPFKFFKFKFFKFFGKGVWGEIKKKSTNVL